jgi:hypothetical protein
MSASTQRSAFAGHPRRVTAWWAVVVALALAATFIWSLPLPAVVLGTLALLWALDNRRSAAPMSTVRRERS